MGQAAERRRAVRRFVRHMNGLKPYIKGASYIVGWKSVLMSSEDLVQEAAMVLWRVIESYPSAKGTELVKLFKTSFSNHLASFYRRQKVKIERLAIPFDPLAAEADQVRRGVMNRILPWDFFRVRLSGLCARLDRERYERLVNVPGRINDQYLRRKEDSLKEYL